MSWAGRVSRQLLTDEPGEAELNHRRYYQEMEEPRKNPDKVNRERERDCFSRQGLLQPMLAVRLWINLNS